MTSVVSPPTWSRSSSLPERQSGGAGRALANGFDEAAQLQNGLAADLAHEAEVVKAEAAELSGSNTEVARAMSELGADISTSHDRAHRTTEICARARSAMARLIGRAQSIDRSIAIVEGVSAQTRLMALNARTEAARAGAVAASSTIEEDLNEVCDDASTTMQCMDEVVDAVTAVANLSEKTKSSVAQQKTMANGMSASIAATSIDGFDVRGRERLCRCVTRPPYADAQLTETRDGRIAYRPAKPKKTGETHVFFTATQLVRRLASQIPPPGQNLLRYHGVLGPAARRRKEVFRSVPPPRAQRQDGDPELREF
jgi:hypothetical protein